MNSGQDRKDAERAARRAQRLAERALERANRKERQAQRAAERAERLAERASHKPSRERDIEDSIEDLVDEVTQKAEAWIGEKTRVLFDSQRSDRERAGGQARRAQREAERARAEASRAEREAAKLEKRRQLEEEQLEEDRLEQERFHQEQDEDYVMGDGYGTDENRSSRRRRRSHRNWHGGWGSGWNSSWYGDDWFETPRRWKRRSGHLYRESRGKKILGVCAGIASYFGRSNWEIRLYAILGLFIIPSVTIPAYFITYFVMDDKPYYRKVTDRFAESATRRGNRRSQRKRGEAFGADAVAGEAEEDWQMDTRQKGRARTGPRHTEYTNVQAMKIAREKFTDIEHRLRKMETHVTSSRFEFDREFRKISGEDA